jgi:NitT/TauT family transport system substrate-binding protein
MTRQPPRRLLGLVVGLLVTASLVACGDDGNDAASGTESPERTGDDASTRSTPIRVGYLASASLAPTFLAEPMGCYDAEGVTVEFSLMSNPADAIALLAEGELDAYAGSPSAGMFNQVEGGANLRLVASLSSIATPEGEEAPSGVFVRSALVSSGEVSDVADLDGRRIGAIGPVGTATSYLLAKVLAEGDLSLADVELVTLTLPDAVPALENGGVDAAYLTAPYTQQALDAGIAEPIADVKEIYGEETTAGLIFGPSLLEDDRAAGAAVLRANGCAAERLQGDYRADDEVVSELSTFLDVPEELIRTGALYAFDPQLRVNDATLDGMQDVFLDYGDVLTYSEPLPASQLTDEELHEEALGDG